MERSKTDSDLQPPRSAIARKEWNDRQNSQIKNIDNNRSTSDLESKTEDESVIDFRSVSNVQIDNRKWDENIDNQTRSVSNVKIDNLNWDENIDNRTRSVSDLQINRDKDGTTRDLVFKECSDVRAGRGMLRVPCASLSTLTGLSVGSRVRPCQAIRTLSTGRGGTSRRTTSPSMLLHGCDWISGEDQRILNLMVLRREAQLEQENVLLSARKLWEKDKMEYNKLLNERRKQWNEFVVERRRAEKMQMEMRKEIAEREMERHILQLEGKINERHERCERIHKQMVVQKKMPRGEVDRDAMRNRIRREQKELEDQQRSEIHVSQVESKERRVEDNLKAILCYRDRSLNERRSKREKRMMAAQQLRDRLNEEFTEWCEESRKILSSRQCICQVRAAKIVDWKRKMTQDKNQLKKLHHSNLMTMLNEEERAREERARQDLLKKEARIRHSLERKEQTKTRSRMNALATANLRQKIRDSYPLA